MNLQALHSRIEAAYHRERQDRDAPVFLIEHGLSPDEVAVLEQALRDEAVSQLRLRSPDDSWWNSRYLALLAFMTEVGYAFGDGGEREYWPRLAGRLGVRELDDELQKALVKLFRRVGECQDPPFTPWTQQFSRIAWPVSNAVLPRWLHTQLFTLLTGCPFRVGEGDAYLRWLQQRAMVTSARRLGLLLNPKREAQAKTLILATLGEPYEEGAVLSEGFLRRVCADVQASPEARRLRTEVQRSQLRVLPSARRRDKGAARSAPVGRLQVPLVLDVRSGALRLGPAQHPALHVNALEQIRVAPLEERRPVSLGRLLRDGGPLERLPEPNPVVELFHERWKGALSGQAKRVVDALWVDLADPVILSSRGREDGLAVQTAERVCGVGSGWWALSAADPPTDGLEQRRAVAGRWRLFRVDASKPAARGWLVARGVVVRETTTVQLFGPPPLHSPLSSSFEEGEVVGLRVTGPPALIATSRLEEGLHRVDGPIDAVVRRSADDAAGQPLRLWREDGLAPPRTVALQLLPLGASAEDLRASVLALRVEGDRAFAGLQVTLVGTCGGVRAVVRCSFADHGELPVHDPAWKALAEALPASGPLELTADVGGVAFARWSLPHLDGFSPDPGEVGDNVPDAFFSADAPLEVKQQAPEGAFLRVHRWERRGGALQEVEVVAPKAQRLGLGAPHALRIPRRSADVLASLGGQCLWRGASVSNVMAAWTRAQTLTSLDEASVAAVCGARWLEAERSLVSPAPLEQALADELVVAGVGWVAELMEEGSVKRARRCFEQRLLELGVRRVRRVAQCEAWAKVHQEELARALEVSLRTLDGAEADVVLDGDDVAAALRRGVEGRARALERAVGALITPRSHLPVLLGLAAEAADLDACAEALSELTSAAAVRRWEVSETNALLRAWCDAGPEVPEGLERAAELAVVDQRVARAVRLVALGWRRGAQ